MRITNRELRAALEAAQTAVKNGNVMTADQHEEQCHENHRCRDHADVISTFARFLFGNRAIDGFPFITTLETLFHEQGLPSLASAVSRVVSLNDQGQFSKALAELTLSVLPAVSECD
jgi:hypothetical protein